MPLQIIGKFLSLLNSNTRLAHLALGGAFGVFLGLLPANSLIWIVLFLLLFFTKINYRFQVIIMGLIKLSSPLYAAALDELGLAILTVPSLQDFFTNLATIPLFWLTRYNNSMVAGGFVAGMALLLPTGLIFALLIHLYRLKLEPLVAKSKLMLAIKRLPLVTKMAKLANSNQ